jgi:hypothetical protein
LQLRVEYTFFEIYKAGHKPMLYWW